MLKMRANKLIIGFVLFLCGLVILKISSQFFINSDTILGKISNIINWNNKIALNCIGIDKKDITIVWCSESDSDKLIIKNGEQVGKIGYEYGPNRFKILLKNGLCFNFGHFKTNNDHTHNYEIEILKNTNGYKIKFVANGPDFEWDEQSFNSHGVLNGKQYSYFKNGKYSSIGNYSNGLMQGEFVFYHRNGKISARDNYLNDKQHGIYVNFDENGNIQSETKYFNGQEIKDVNNLSPQE